MKSGGAFECGRAEILDSVRTVQISDAAGETRDWPEPEGEEIEVMDAVLEKRAPGGQRRIVAPCARVNAAGWEVLVVAHRDREHTTGAGVAKHVGDHVVDGREAHHEADLALHAGGLDRRGHLGGIGRGHREWFLAKDRLASLCRSDASLMMLRGRSAYPYCVD